MGRWPSTASPGLEPWCATATTAPPRASSTSANVELLVQGADVLVHSTIHPVMGPDGGGTFPPPLFFRQSTATDVGAMAQRAGVTHVLLTHLVPSLGAASLGPFAVPGGPLDKGDYKDAVRAGGYRGDIRVGEDLLTLRIPSDGWPLPDRGPFR